MRTSEILAGLRGFFVDTHLALCWTRLRSSLPVVATKAWLRFIVAGLCVAVCAFTVDCAGEYVHYLPATAAPPFHSAYRC